MKTFEEPMIEVAVFAVEDVITMSSGEHDNAFGDIGDLLNAIFNH
jgi:hypothetical protein